MGIFGIIAGLAGGGSVIGVIGLAIFAPGLLANIVKAALEVATTVLDWAVEHWKVVVPTLIVVAAVIYILILQGDHRHDGKVIAGQASLIADVKKEVDRGACQAATAAGWKCQPTQAADAPTYIRGFVDNLATAQAGEAREEAAAKAAHADAVAVNAAAHQDRQATPTEQQNEKVRVQISDPARTTGITADEWGKL